MRASTISLLALFAACGGNAADDTEVSSITYRSPVYGYSIAHPAGWSVVDARRPLSVGEPPATASGATDILGRNASVRVSTMRLPGVIIAAEPVAKTTDIASWRASIIGTVKFMKNCVRPDRSEDVDIGGESGTLLTYRDCPPDLGYLHLWAGVVHNGRGFQIVWFNNPGDEAADRRSFRKILSSMSFDE